MARLRQPVRILEGRITHPQRLGRLGHPCCKPRLVAAQRIANRRRRIIGRFHCRCADQIAQRNLLTGLQPQLRGWLGRGILGYGDHRIERNLTPTNGIKRDIKGQHFGQRRRMQPRVRILLIQRLAAARIDHDRRIRRGMSCTNRRYCYNCRNCEQ